MPLTTDEVAFMQEGGTGLEPIPQAPDRRRRLPLIGVRIGFRPKDEPEYRLTTDCAYLTQKMDTGELLCEAHEDPRRPQVCNDFTPGSIGCRVMRTRAELDTPGELATFLAVTGQDGTMPESPA